MSRTLCLYPAEQIYTPEYRSASADIATRRLALARPSATATSWPTSCSTRITRW